MDLSALRREAVVGLTRVPRVDWLPWHCAGIAWVLLWPLIVHAAEPIDMVRLDDGSVIKGEILRLNEDDELVVDTDFADEVEIEVEHIVAIEVDRLFTVRRLDGKKITGYLAISDGQLVVQATPSVPALPKPAPPDSVPLPAPEPEAAAPSGGPHPDELAARTLIPFREIDWIEEKPTFYRYNAAFNVGVQAARGNTDTTDLHFDARFQPSFGWDTVTLAAQYDKKEADGDTTTDRLSALFIYEHDFDRRWLGGLITTYERDRQRDLARRVLSGAGGGYKLFDHDPTHLKIFLALAYVSEDFTDDTKDRQYPGALWRLALERDLYKDDVTLYHNHQFVDSLQNLGNFLAETTTGLAVDVFDFTLSAEFQFDWTNEPASGSKQEDTRYLLKIGYEFEGDENDWWQ